jgi:hypothetical protein
MWKPLLPLLEVLDRYHGLLIGVAALGVVLLANLVAYRRGWKSYPTLKQYLAAHPGCETPGGVVCVICHRRAMGMNVPGSGRIFCCAWCETELYRVDNG